MFHVKHYIWLAPAVLMALPNDTALLLKRHAGFTGEQLDTVRRGGRVVRMIDTGSQAEVAFAGVTRLRVALPEYLKRVRAGTLYKVRDPILQVGRFAETPSMKDLINLRFDGGDLPGPAEQNKRWLLATIRQYEATGAISFGALGEQPKPVESASLFARANYLRERFPDAWQHLLRYPNVPSRGTDDYYQWTQITFGFRPVTRIAQVSVWESGPHEAVVVTKQIYANRYFEGSYQIDHLISDDSDPKHPAVYLITFNYGRSGFLDGIPGRLIRPVVMSRTRASAEKALDDAKEDFQSELL
jgi:hypothetical protein